MATGIYLIHSIKHPARHYVGSSVCFTLRKKLHLSELLHNCHHNAILQNHVNKYGISDLYFSFIEECSRSELITREQFYIDSIKPFFNINPTAGSRLGSKHSAATKLRIGKASKRNFHKHRFNPSNHRFVK